MLATAGWPAQGEERARHEHLMLQRAADGPTLGSSAWAGAALVSWSTPQSARKPSPCSTASRSATPMQPPEATWSPISRSCESTMYKVRRWIAAGERRAYPISIPVAVGWQLFGEKNIKKGMGPSEFESCVK